LRQGRAGLPAPEKWGKTKAAAAPAAALEGRPASLPGTTGLPLSA